MFVAKMTCGGKDGGWLKRQVPMTCYTHNCTAAAGSAGRHSTRAGVSRRTDLALARRSGVKNLGLLLRRKRRVDGHDQQIARNHALDLP